MVEVDRYHLSGIAVTDSKPSGGAEADRGDDRFRPEFGFVVGMPADGVGAAAVSVGEDAVEGFAGHVDQAVSQSSQRGVPIGPLELLSRVPVVGVGLSKPAFEPGDTVAFAVHDRLSVLPWDLVAQRRE